jgi:hypothetical protein
VGLEHADLDLGVPVRKRLEERGYDPRRRSGCDPRPHAAHHARLEVPADCTRLVRGEGRVRALEEISPGARFTVREPYAASDERRVIKPRIGNV